MAYEPVDLLVVDDSPATTPVEGVVVKVYDEAGAIFYTQATTNNEGVASFLLPSSLKFQFRFYRFATTFQQPQTFEVLAAPNPNKFVTTAHIFKRPEATDLRLCRCSGYFRRPDGKPAKNLDLHLVNKFKPMLLEGSGVLTERLRKKTDADGYIEVDLIRFGQYEVLIEGLEDCLRLVHVPDAPSANLPDLVFPVVEQVILNPEGSFAVSVGAQIEVIPSVFSSDGRQLPGTATEDVRWSTEDDSIALVLPNRETLVIQGASPGTTNLIASRRDQSIVRVPNTPILGQPVTITVT